MWDEIRNPQNKFRPVTVLHVCSSHLIRAATKRIKTFTDDHGMRILCGRVVALLIHSTSMDKADEIIKLCSQVFGMRRKASDHEDAVNTLKRRVSPESSGACHEPTTKELDDLLGNTSAEDEKEEEPIDMPVSRNESPFHVHFNSIYENTVAQETGENEKPFYNEAFISYLLNELLPFFPLWSALIIQRFGITRDSNAPAENWFKIIKFLVFNNEMKQVIPRFIQKSESLLWGRFQKKKYGMKTTRQSQRMCTSKELQPSKRKTEKQKLQKKIAPKENIPIPKSKVQKIKENNGTPKTTVRKPKKKIQKPKRKIGEQLSKGKGKKSKGKGQKSKENEICIEVSDEFWLRKQEEVEGNYFQPFPKFLDIGSQTESQIGKKKRKTETKIEVTKQGESESHPSTPFILDDIDMNDFPAFQTNILSVDHDINRGTEAQADANDEQKGTGIVIDDIDMNRTEAPTVDRHE